MRQASLRLGGRAPAAVPDGGRVGSVDRAPRPLAPRRPLPTSGIPATTPGPAPTAQITRSSPGPDPRDTAADAARPGGAPPAAVPSPGDARRNALGDARRQAAHWCRRYRAGGDGAVAAARRRHGVLTRAQELALIETMRDRFPDQLNLTGPLWSRQTVAALVERLYDVPLTPAAAGRYLRAWGITAREPVDRACPLCAEDVVRWQAETYPAISRSAQQHRAEIYWAGKTRLHGVAPTTEVVSAVSIRGWVRFMVTTEPDLPREFLARLRPRSGRPAHVVADGSWSYAEWPRRVPEGVVLHALPSCERRR